MRNSANARLPSMRDANGARPARVGTIGVSALPSASTTTASSIAPPAVASISLWRTTSAK